MEKKSEETAIAATAVVIAAEEVAELAREGLKLRREIERRFAKMREVTYEDLKTRVR